jgi:hypothetical protein
MAYSGLVLLPPAPCAAGKNAVRQEHFETVAPCAVQVFV